MLKTYLTKCRVAVEQHFANHDTFIITQSFWLTPELETQLETMRQATP
jgi:hypothetical protein